VGLLVHKVAPVYPESARQNRVQGTVVFGAVIDKNGRIAELKPVSGPKELIPAAMGAVQQWRYKPYFLEGQPVAVETQIVVNFQLR
jgi:TonB family protein